eukprot:CAMPEP_0174887150 /NCGR_PEP_ID=MMETSP0167-20121228/2383_1 /TAXON_ID=38298 /ORGANISM="Rhodella maculata, Strain CCMP736" /LENGTH=351 /DNA_ID=CAMNT_0016123487 /DNA_START=21 /DNA_END=1076 /DNA_ORIENTATION=-
MSAPAAPAASPLLASLNSKLAAAQEPPTIVTHSGTFHCDEALACYMLRLLPGLDSAPIKRTRDQPYIDDASSLKIVVDVGATYEPAAFRFDHHQRSFAETLGERDFSKTKLSSAGLVYKHFGRDIVRLLCGDLSPEDVDRVYFKIYESFVEEVDAIDNGVHPFDCDPTQIKYRYGSTGLSARVGRLNPDWNEPASDEDARFARAMALAGEEFAATLHHYAKSWLPARTIVRAMLESRFDAHPSGEIGILPQFAPWKSHVYELEKELAVDKTLKYVVYEDASGSFRVQAVPVAEASFESRRPLPEPWRGVRNTELSAMLGIPDCVFVHASGFIGGNRTKEGAMKMAEMALEL